MTFTYSNRSPRPRGRFLRVVGVVLPGVERVQSDVVPFADAWQRHNTAALAAGEAPLWVALGDSLTLGVGASAHDAGWVGQLSRTLAAEGFRHRLVNLAVSGATTADALDRQLPVLHELSASHDVGLVTLMIGSNNLMRAARRRELPDHMRRIVAQLPSGAVVTTLPNPSRAATASNRALSAAAAVHDVVVVELRGPRTASWRGKLAADHFHPNDLGYATLAEVIAERLRGVGLSG